MRRNGGTPCWLHFSWLLLAPAQNRFRVVRDLRFSVVEGPLCVPQPIYFRGQRQRSPSRHLWRVGVQRLVGFYFSSAVLGFAFPNRIRVVRDLCFSVVEGP